MNESILSSLKKIVEAKGGTSEAKNISEALYEIAVLEGYEPPANEQEPETPEPENPLIPDEP